MVSLSRRRFFALTAVSAGSLTTGGGCGTFIHPERRGQPVGDIDWKIVALDALGLLLFFVPGIIAFAVDFSTGAIYLPPAYQRLPPYPQPYPPQPGQTYPPYAQPLSENAGDARTLVTVNVPSERLSLEQVEHVVSKHTEREVRLKPGTYQTEKLRSLDDFWVSADKLWRPWKKRG